MRGEQYAFLASHLIFITLWFNTINIMNNVEQFSGIPTLQQSLEFLWECGQDFAQSGQLYISDTEIPDLCDDIIEDMTNALNVDERFYIIFPVHLGFAYHMIGIGFDSADSNNSRRALYCDPTGQAFNRQNDLPLSCLVRALELSERVILQTSIDQQQYREHQQVCGLWAAKNAIDFLTNGKVAAPQSAEEAALFIQPYLCRYYDLTQSFPCELALSI